MRKAWNKGLTKETDERIASYSKKLEGHYVSERVKREHSEFMKGNKYKKGKTHSEETRKLQRELQLGEKASRWKGGDYYWLHKEARKLFGVGKCEVCGITEEDYIKQTGRRLDMHCDGKRYRNLERIFWTECCITCHQKLETLDK